MSPYKDVAAQKEAQRVWAAKKRASMTPKQITAVNKKRQQRRKARKRITHGEAGYSKHGCRCRVCLTTYRENRKKYQATAQRNAAQAKLDAVPVTCVETVEEFVARGGQITKVPEGLSTEPVEHRDKPSWFRISTVR